MRSHLSHCPEPLAWAAPEPAQGDEDDDHDGGGDQGEHQAQVAASLVARIAALGRVTRMRLALYLEHRDALGQLGGVHMGAVGGGVRGLNKDQIRKSSRFTKSNMCSLMLIMVHLVPADLVEVVPGPSPAPAPGPGVVGPQVVAGEGGVKHLVDQVIKDIIWNSKGLVSKHKECCHSHSDCHGERRDTEHMSSLARAPASRGLNKILR